MPSVNRNRRASFNGDVKQKATKVLARPLKKKQRLTRPLRKKDKGKEQKEKGKEDGRADASDKSGVQWRSPGEQAQWFAAQFHSFFGPVVSSLEQDVVPAEKFAHLEEAKDRSVESLADHVKSVIGPSWQETLCGTELTADGESGREAGSISLLVICSSANRCVDLLRGLKSFSTTDCPPAKLFAKHIKVEEQVKALNRRVNIAAGTPSRIRKLVDLGALGLGQLSLVLLDMHQDAKGLTVLSVPDVQREFWELYRRHLHPALLSQQLRLCLY